MSNPFILLWLEAPLQSWGADSKFFRRDTQKFPTKSGVLGLLCCALGAGGEQRELLSKFSSLSQTVLSFVRIKSQRECLTSIIFSGRRQLSLPVDPFWDGVMSCHSSSGFSGERGAKPPTYKLLNYINSQMKKRKPLPPRGEPRLDLG